MTKHQSNQMDRDPSVQAFQAWCAEKGVLQFARYTDQHADIDGWARATHNGKLYLVEIKANNVERAAKLNIRKLAKLRDLSHPPLLGALFVSVNIDQRWLAVVNVWTAIPLRVRVEGPPRMANSPEPLIEYDLDGPGTNSYQW